MNSKLSLRIRLCLGVDHSTDLRYPRIVSSILRKRKNSYVIAVSAYERSGFLNKQEADGFRALYRRARTLEEQDQIRAAIEHRIDGWKTGTDRYSRVMQNIAEARDKD